MDADGLKQEIDRKIYEVKRLITNIEELLEEKKYEKYIPKEVKEFVLYIKEYVNISNEHFNFTRQISQETFSIPVLTALLSLLDTFKEGFFSLHHFFKEIIEISILESPSPLLIYFNKILRKIYRDGKIIATKQSEYNFHFIPLYKISGRPLLDPNRKLEHFALIRYPFSEYKNVFSNILLIHELGHFIYKKLNIKNKIISSIDPQEFDQYEQAINEYVETNYQSDYIIETPPKMWETIFSWWEESFADFFAVRIIGPAFLYAFIKFNLILKDTEIKIFISQHPSRYYRIGRGSQVQEGLDRRKA